MIFFTSDTHFGHRLMARFRGFGDDTETMDDLLVAQWNAMVSPDDEVWHLGDFAFMPPVRIREVFQRLRGRIHLIRGNHDQNFGPKLRGDLSVLGRLTSFHEGYKELRHDGQKFVLSHYAHRVWNRSHFGSIHLYGHSHGSLPGVGRSVDVGVDSKELAAFTGERLRPWSMVEILAYMEPRGVHVVDHHEPKDWNITFDQIRPEG